jgi:hypothetical protein
MRQYLPLEDDVFSSVMRRVVYRLIALHYKRHPFQWQGYAPSRVYELGKQLQAEFPSLMPWFLFFSKNMAHGCTTTFLRDCELPDAPRALHKRRIHRPR